MDAVVGPVVGGPVGSTFVDPVVDGASGAGGAVLPDSNAGGGGSGAGGNASSNSMMLVVLLVVGLLGLILVGALLCVKKQET